MASDVVTKTGFPPGLRNHHLADAFVAHNEAVKEAIPPERLLVYEVRDGWELLCAFLDVPIPDEEFPRTNHREEFWDRVNGKL